jgi:hypothetical protein
MHGRIFDGCSTYNSATNAMSKTLTEAQVTTAKARSRLELGVHWRRLDAEAHLGYRKGKWVAFGLSAGVITTKAAKGHDQAAARE